MNPWKTCARKRKYASHAEAETMRQFYEITGIGGLVVYQCLCCWYWHLGHLTPRLLSKQAVIQMENGKQASGDTYANE